MRYLVVGGAGFIGSNIVAELRGLGHGVVVVDAFTTGSMCNLEGIGGVEIFHMEDRQLPILSFCDTERVIWVDGASSSPMYKEDPSLTGRVIEGFIRTLDYARRHKAKLVFASSSSIYNGNSIPWKEDMPIHITDFYTEARVSMERLSKLYYELYGVESVALRPFSVYGRNERTKGQYANLVSQIIWAIEREEEFVIYGDGGQSRDYTYIDDVVNAFLLTMDSDIKSGVFNIGTGVSYPLNDVIQIIEGLMGKKLSKEYIANPIKHYISDTLANTYKARNHLGFEAKYSLEDGLKALLGMEVI